jgi:phospholipid/cholesterol/gamma-HCH transport system substrate-binding protein
MRLSCVRPGPGPRPIASRLFEDRQKVDKVEPAAAVTAFNDAFGRMARDTITWTVQTL